VIDPAVALDLVVRITVAIVFGAAIGLERQWRLRTAGIRTNALVAAGSALFVILGAVGLGEQAQADPTRVAAQVVSGIGFLGAGVILRDGLNIRGLTTAATLWCAAAVGSLSGAGMESVAFIGCAAIIATNTLLRPVGRLVNRRSGYDDASVASADDGGAPIDYVFEVVTAEKNEPRVRALVLQAVNRPDFTLRSLDIRHGKQTRVLAGVSALRSADTGDLEVAFQRISLDPNVLSSRWWAADAED
jgi:putative Mg2+ transporter-C (MgtC) family protein